MTSSSSPGVSLMQESLSYMAGSELPCVIINMQRGGPGLGDISTSQADYFQSVKGGGHGDYRIIVLAPSTVQETADLVYDAFDELQKMKKEEPLTLFKKALDNIKPNMEVRSRRIGGANYQVPVEVRPTRKLSLSLKWLVDVSRKRSEKSMSKK